MALILFDFHLLLMLGFSKKKNSDITCFIKTGTLISFIKKCQPWVDTPFNITKKGTIKASLLYMNFTSLTCFSKPSTVNSKDPKAISTAFQIFLHMQWVSSGSIHPRSQKALPKCWWTVFQESSVFHKIRVQHCSIATAQPIHGSCSLWVGSEVETGLYLMKYEDNRNSATYLVS